MPSVMIFIQFLQDPTGPHVNLLREAGLEVRFPPRPDLTDEEETVRVLQGISATIAGGEPYSRRVMAALPDLRVISRWGVGVDRIDMEAVTGRNVAVTITPTANYEAVAEHAVGAAAGNESFSGPEERRNPPGPVGAKVFAAPSREDAGPDRAGTHRPERGRAGQGLPDAAAGPRGLSGPGLRSQTRHRAGGSGHPAGGFRLRQSARAPDGGNRAA